MVNENAPLLLEKRGAFLLVDIGIKTQVCAGILVGRIKIFEWGLDKNVDSCILE